MANQNSNNKKEDKYGYSKYEYAFGKDYQVALHEDCPLNKNSYVEYNDKNPNHKRNDYQMCPLELYLMEKRCKVTDLSKEKILKLCPSAWRFDDMYNLPGCCAAAAVMHTVCREAENSRTSYRNGHQHYVAPKAKEQNFVYDPDWIYDLPSKLVPIFEKLTEIQVRRIYYRFELGYKLEEIRIVEGVGESSVRKSIDAGVDKLRKILLKMGVTDPEAWICSVLSVRK